jgi:putative transcriptional regulator
MAAAKKSAKRGGTAAGRQLIAGLREALHAAQTGDYSNMIVREVEIPDPRHYGPAEVKALRAKLGVTQGIFARLMGVSPELVAHWEYDMRKPAPLACRLMDKISEDPAKYLASLVKRRRVAGPPPRHRRAG